jgi:hypothetical protein
MTKTQLACNVTSRSSYFARIIQTRIMVCQRFTFAGMVTSGRLALAQLIRLTPVAKESEMSVSNKSQVRKIEAMTRQEKEAYFSTAKRVTVSTITQVFDNHLKVSYVAKIRGVIVGDEGEYKHETPGAAMKYGKEVLNQWRKEFTAAQPGFAPDAASVAVKAGEPAPVLSSVKPASSQAAPVM